MVRNWIAPPLIAGLCLLFSGADPAGAAQPNDAVAQFEGRTIRLSESWGAARACDVRPTGTFCFRSEAEMDAAAPLAVGARSATAAAPSVATGTCSSSLRLYDGSSFTGTVVQITLTGARVDLTPKGFAGRTSSYRVGACSAAFWAGASLYPGATNSGVASATMLPGWDNTISAVVM